MLFFKFFFYIFVILFETNQSKQVQFSNGYHKQDRWRWGVTKLLSSESDNGPITGENNTFPHNSLAVKNKRQVLDFCTSRLFIFNISVWQFLVFPPKKVPDHSQWFSKGQKL